MWEAWPAVSLKEVADERDNSVHFIFLKRREDFLSLSLLNGSQSYQAELRVEDVRDMSESSRIPFEDFLKQTVSALTSNILTEDQFSYSLLRKESSLQLVWKKVLPDDAVKIKLASLELRKTDHSDGVCNTLRQLCKFVLEKSQQTKSFRDEKLKLETENQKLRTVLETEVVKKEQLEREMYCKFALVLNEKKEKCRLYKQQISELKRRQSSVSGAEESPADAEEPTVTPKKTKDPGLLFEDSSDESGPTQVQRIVKNNNRRRAIPRGGGEGTKRLSKRRTNSRVAAVAVESSSLLADTQELMDDL